MADPRPRRSPIILSEMEASAVLAALGDDPARLLPPDRPDLTAALVRAVRTMRQEIQDAEKRRRDR